MDITKAEQIALDDALVAPANRLKIGKCNLRLSSDLTSKEATLQVVYDVLKLTPFYKAFQASADVLEIYMQEFWATASVHNRSIRFKINNKKHIVNLEYFREMFQICPIICNQKFDEPPFEQEILTFLISLGHSGEIRKITDVNYYAIASGEVPPKTKASVHKKKANFDTTPKEKPPTNPKDKRVKQTGKMIGSRKQKQPATGDGVDILSKVPDEQVHKKTGTDEGAGDKPEVPDVPEHHSNSEEESWTFSDGDDDDEDDDANKDSDAHDDDDDDATESDDDGDNITHPKLSTFSTDDQEENNDEEEQEEDDEDEEEISDQLVRTPSDYQTPDESEKQKDDDRVKDGEEDKEGDVTNVNLEGGDVDITEADTTKDTEDTHVTLTAATPVVQQQSSSVSDLVSKFISPTMDKGIDSILTPHTKSTTLVNVPISVATETLATTTTIPPPLFPVTQSSQQTPVTTTITTNPSTTSLPIPNFASVFGFNQRVTALESDLSKFKQSNPFAKAILFIPGIVNEYLGSKMKEAVDMAIQLKSNKLREEAQAENQEFLNSLDSNMQKIIKDQVKTQTSKIKSKVEKILMDKMEENKSIDRSDVQKNIYNALVEAYNTDKDLLSSYGDVLIIPRTRDDKDKDEEPSAGSNRGTKRWKSGKETESSKEPTRKESRTTSSSKGASRSPPIDLNETTYLEFITGDDDVIPAREVHDER
ncbi:hypothetical protein Tco_0674032 [Tanacetum coccineum]